MRKNIITYTSLRKTIVASSPDYGDETSDNKTLARNEKHKRNSTAKSGRYKLLLERSKIIYPSWSAPITFVPVAPVAQARPITRYIL